MVCCVVLPASQCKLRLLKLERVKDFLIIEEEYIRNQELLKPKQAKDDVSASTVVVTIPPGMLSVSLGLGGKIESG